MVLLKSVTLQLINYRTNCMVKKNSKIIPLTIYPKYDFKNNILEFDWLLEHLRVIYPEIHH